MKTHHVCYEGTLACSGCNPCAHCLDVVNREVLAIAMGRTTEAIANARGPKGVVSVAELDAHNFWAVFYGFYGEAWRTLHVAMMSDAKVAERAYDLRGIPGFLETGRYVPPALASLSMQLPFPPAAMQVPMQVPVPMAAPSPPAPVPLSALVVPAPAPFAPLPGAEMPFTLREEVPATREAVAQAVSSVGGVPALTELFTDIAPLPAPVDVAQGNAKLEMNATYGKTAQDVRGIDITSAYPIAVGPADIRREITAEDIAASVTVIEASASPANGVAAHE